MISTILKKIDVISDGIILLHLENFIIFKNKKKLKLNV